MRSNPEAQNDPAQSDTTGQVDRGGLHEKVTVYGRDGVREMLSVNLDAETVAKVR